MRFNFNFQPELSQFISTFSVTLSVTLSHIFCSCMNTAFKAVEALDEKDLKSKEVTALSDLLAALKRLCVEFWPSNADDCDRLRLTVICRMLKTPHFNCR